MVIVAVVPGLPPWAEWGGLIVTVIGTFFAISAAVRAKGAREQANLAREAAIRLGRVTQAIDLVTDLQELPTLLARRNFRAIADKCARLRGRIVRFKGEAYNELSERELESLDVGEAQLEIIARTATDGEVSVSARTDAIQNACRKLEVVLNRVSGARHRKARGE